MEVKNVEIVTSKKRIFSSDEAYQASLERAKRLFAYQPEATL